MLYISYFFGTTAILFLIISFQTNDKINLLKYQTISSFSNFFHYLLIGSLAGALMNFVAGIRNIVFKKYKDKIPLNILIAFIIIITLLSMMSYNGNISLLPMLAVLNYSYSLWTGNLKLIRLINIFSSSLFIIYDINVFSVTGFILHLLEMLSSIISIYRFDIRRN